MAETVAVGQVLHVLAQRAYHELDLLVSSLKPKDSTARKEAILRYLHVTRTRFMRLLVVLKSVEVSAAADQCAEIVRHFESKGNIFGEAAHHLQSHYHELMVSGARIPAYPIPNAVDMLANRGYSRMPKLLDELVPPRPPSTEEVANSVGWLDAQLSARLTETRVPRTISSARIERGRLWLREDGLFEVSLTLSGPGLSSSWRLLSVDVLVTAETVEPSTKLHGAFNDRVVAQDQIPTLHRIIQEKLSIADALDPLFHGCVALRAFSLSLRLTVLADEAYKRIQNRWGDTVKLTAESGKIMRLEYWQRENCATPTVQIILVKHYCPTHRGVVVDCSIDVTHIPELRDVGTDTVVSFSADDSIDTILNCAKRHTAASRLHAIVDELARAGMYPSGLAGFSMSLTCGPGEPCLNLHYDLSSSHVLSDAEASTLCLKLLVNNGSGKFRLQCTELTDDAKWTHFFDSCARALSKSVTSAPKIVRDLTFQLDIYRLQHQVTGLPLQLHRLPPIACADGSASDVATVEYIFNDHPRFILRVTMQRRTEQDPIKFALVETDYVEPIAGMRLIKPVLCTPVEQLSSHSTSEASSKRRRVDHETGIIGLRDSVIICLTYIPQYQVKKGLERWGIRYTLPLGSDQGLILQLPSGTNESELKSHFKRCSFVIRGCQVHTIIELSDSVPSSAISNIRVIQFSSSCSGFADDLVATWSGACAMFLLVSGDTVEENVLREANYSSLRIQTDDFTADVRYGRPKMPDGNIPYTVLVPRGSAHALITSELASDLIESQSLRLLLHNLQHSFETLRCIDNVVQQSQQRCTYKPTSCLAGKLLYKEDKLILLIAATEPGMVSVQGQVGMATTASVASTNIAGLLDFLKAYDSDARPDRQGAIFVTESAFAQACGIDGKGEPPILRYLHAVHLRVLMQSLTKDLPVVCKPDNDLVLLLQNPHNQDIFRFGFVPSRETIMVKFEASYGFSNAETAVVERFFNERVFREYACTSSAVEAFLNILCAPQIVLRDLVKLMAADLGEQSASLTRLYLVTPQGLNPMFECYQPPSPAVLVEHDDTDETDKVYLIVQRRGEDLAVCYKSRTDEFGWGWGAAGDRKSEVIDELRACTAQPALAAALLG